jgi:hypothetical protein
MGRKIRCPDTPRVRMADDLDFDATVDVLVDYCEIVALIGPLDWVSFVHGYRAYDAWYAGEATGSLEHAPPEGRTSSPPHAKVA